MSNQFQDWNPVVIGNRHNKKENPINLKHRENQHIETIKKEKNKNDNILLSKIENEEIIKLEKIPLNVSIKIQQNRNICKMSRKELAQKLNIKENIIIDIENGKYKFDKQLIRKIEKILNCNIL